MYKLDVLECCKLTADVVFSSDFVGISRISFQSIVEGRDNADSEALISLSNSSREVRR